MPYEEAKRWNQGENSADFYNENLEEIKQERERKSHLLDVIKNADMPWEDSPMGHIKHLVNERMNTRVSTIDAYIQELPPGGRSGKHHHSAEEYHFILEGQGYDMHWDMDAELGERYTWKAQEEGKRWDWEEGDAVYIPPNTVHQHFNADPNKPARFISATNRVFKLVGYNDMEHLEDAPGYER